MKIKTDLMERRNKAIYSDWTKFCEQKVATEKAMTELENKYYLKKDTIFRVIKKASNGRF